MERLRYDARDGRAIVLTSPSLMAIMAATYPKARSAMSVITPGVKRVLGPASDEERKAARARLGLPTEGSCILFVANDYRKKGLPTLLESLKKLPTNYYLVVVGNASQIVFFRAAVKELGLEQFVFFLGSLLDVSDAFIAANCLAHPTLEDTFAMVVLEAMAYGLPVIVSSAKYCGVAQLLTDKVNALVLTNPLDANELAKAVGTVFKSAAAAELLSTSALTFARSYLWSAIAVRQEAIYLSN
jgi:UDP-glucose:(heptosyl)LPS alpha-1,3-glucosyltransferase